MATAPDRETITQQIIITDSVTSSRECEFIGTFRSLVFKSSNLFKITRIRNRMLRQRTVNYKIEIARLRIRRRISRGRNRVSQGAAPWWNTGHLRRQISGIIMSRGAMHLCKWDTERNLVAQCFVGSYECTRDRTPHNAGDTVTTIRKFKV